MTEGNSEQEERSYPLPKETLPGLGMDSHLADMMEFKAFVESRGIRTSRTRIERYCNYLRRVVAGDGGDAYKVFERHPTESFSDLIECRLYVLREVHELMWILKGGRKKCGSGIR